MTQIHQTAFNKKYIYCSGLIAQFVRHETDYLKIASSITALDIDRPGSSANLTTMKWVAGMWAGMASWLCTLFVHVMLPGGSRWSRNVQVQAVE